jgi:hypothetical protein
MGIVVGIRYLVCFWVRAIRVTRIFSLVGPGFYKLRPAEQHISKQLSSVHKKRDSPQEIWISFHGAIFPSGLTSHRPYPVLRVF